MSPVLAIFSTGHQERVVRLWALQGLHVKCVFFAAWKHLLWATVHAGYCSHSWLMVLDLIPTFAKKITDVDESSSTAVTFGPIEFPTLTISLEAIALQLND